LGAGEDFYESVYSGTDERVALGVVGVDRENEFFTGGRNHIAAQCVDAAQAAGFGPYGAMGMARLETVFERSVHAAQG
jgi:hypothetical protein